MKVFAISGDCAANGMSNTTSVFETQDEESTKHLVEWMAINATMRKFEHENIQRMLSVGLTQDEKDEYMKLSNRFVECAKSLGWHKYMARTTWITHDDAKKLTVADLCGDDYGYSRKSARKFLALVQS